MPLFKQRSVSGQ